MIQSKLLSTKWVGAVVAACVALLLTAGDASAQGRLSGRTRVRPIQDFLATQGTYCFPPEGGQGCFLFVPPLENFLGWSDPARMQFASVDYAGIAGAWLANNSGGAIALGTSFRGSVVERPLGDGRAEVRVLLHTSNALSWIVQGFDFAAGPLLFGHRAPDVLGGKTPALGDCFMDLVFINTAPGAALPDFVQLANSPTAGQELRFVSFRAMAEGEIREAFGVAEGTPGIATVTETGLLMTAFQGATADAFPVERIDIKAVGQ